MADLINFTLPSIDEGTDEKTMKQIKNYLFQLTEQMKFYLNNIDADNFTDAYNTKLSSMASAQTTNSRKQSITEQKLKEFQNDMQSSINNITGNSGGYVMLHDTNGDSFPDEILIMEKSDIDAEDNKIWRWNNEGLMFNNGGYKNANCWNTTVAIDMNGHINADFINAGTLKGIVIEAAQGKIANWSIDSPKYNNGNYYNGGLYSDSGDYRIFLQGAYSAADTSLENSWALSTQIKKDDGIYYGTYVLRADGVQEWYRPVNAYSSADLNFQYNKIRYRNLTFENEVNTGIGIELGNYVNSAFLAQDNSVVCILDGRIYNTYTSGATVTCLAGYAYLNDGWTLPIIVADTPYNVWFAGVGVDAVIHTVQEFTYTCANGETETWYCNINAVAMPGQLASTGGYGIYLGAFNSVIEAATWLVALYYGGTTYWKAKNDLTIGTPTSYLYFSNQNEEISTSNFKSDIIYAGPSKTLEISRCDWNFEGNTAPRDYIQSKGGLVLSANAGNNAMYLSASSIRHYGDTYLNFMATSGTLSLVVNTRGKITVPSSSKRYKENIVNELADDLNPHGLYDCPVVQYNYKPEFKDIELVTGTQIGVLAEDLDKYYPNACIYNKDGQPESWQDRIMIPAMLKLIQEQHEQIEEIKNILKENEHENNS